MILNWKPFKISAKSFVTFLETNLPKADGIVATPAHLEIIERSAFTPEEMALVMSYYTPLTASGELEKIAANKKAREDAQRALLASLIQDLGNGQD